MNWLTIWLNCSLACGMPQMLLWASLLKVPEDDDLPGLAAAQSRPTWHAASTAEAPTFDVNQVTSPVLAAAIKP